MDTFEYQVLLCRPLPPKRSKEKMVLNTTFVASFSVSKHISSRFFMENVMPPKPVWVFIISFSPPALFVFSHGFHPRISSSITFHLMQHCQVYIRDSYRAVLVCPDGPRLHQYEGHRAEWATLPLWIGCSCLLPGGLQNPWEHLFSVYKPLQHSMKLASCQSGDYAAEWNITS